MSLTVSLMEDQPVEIFHRNITHNLGDMARAVVLSNGMTLYGVLWRPDEEGRLKYARDISKLLSEGWDILIADPDKYTKLNPTNGWGSYDGLCDFVYDYHQACLANPDAELDVSL